MENQVFGNHYYGIGEANEGDGQDNGVRQANPESHKANPLGRKDNPGVRQANPRAFEPYTSVGHANEQALLPTFLYLGSRVISIERYELCFHVYFHCRDIVNTASVPEFPEVRSPFKWQIQAQWTVLNRIPNDPVSIRVQLELLMTRSPKKQPYWFYCITAYTGLDNSTTMQTLEIFPDRPHLICIKNIVVPFVHFQSGLLPLFVHMQLQEMTNDKSLTPNFEHNSIDLLGVRYASALGMP